MVDLLKVYRGMFLIESSRHYEIVKVAFLILLMTQMAAIKALYGIENCKRELQKAAI